MSSEDLAHNPRLWAYNTGRSDRQKNLVVRIRTDEKADSKAASATLNIEDHTGAGMEWSSSELEVTNVNRSELVVVVGELLPQDLVAEAVFNPANGKVAFNPQHHTTIPTCEATGVVVRRLGDQKCNLFLLHSKMNLCQISQLPRGLDNRLVYYNEWAHGCDDKRHTKRQSVWRSNVNSFCSQYLAEHANDFLDLEKTSTLKEHMTKGWKPTIDLFDGLQSTIFKSIYMYEKTGSSSFLKHAINRVDDALGKQKKQNVGGKPSALEEYHQIIHNLIEGSDTFDIDDAQEALNAYKALWPTQLQSGIELQINAEILVQLATGLRNEAMQGRVIPEAFYRAFIVAFCCSDAATGSDVQARDDAIVKAYNYAAFSVGDSPAPPPIPIGIGNSHEGLVLLLEHLLRVRSRHIKSFQTWMRVEREQFAEENDKNGATDDLEKLLHDLPNAMDWDTARNKLSHIAQHIQIRYQSSVEELVGLLETEMESFREIIRGLANGNGGDKDNDEDKDEN